jgi:hypothetical protein
MATAPLALPGPALVMTRTYQEALLTSKRGFISRSSGIAYFAIDRSAPAAWAQRAKAWVSVPGVAWPPDCTMLLHDAGADVPSATAVAAAVLG